MDRNEKAASAGTDSGSEVNAEVTVYCPPEQAATQRTAILAHLTRYGSLSTLEARRWYSVMSPASRVFELRRQGHGITTTRDARQKCARYHLTGGGDHAKQG